MPRPAVLLIHGFTSHRSSLEALIPPLEQRGIDWHYPILAGHGTRPQDLTDTRWPDWQADAEQAWQYLRQAHDRIVIVALSMGSLLALELAAAHPTDVAGLVLLSPCLRFKNPLAKHTAWLSRLLPTFRNPSAAKFSSAAYARRDQGYRWFPTAAYRSYWQRTHEMDPTTDHVRCPVRIIHSRSDMIAEPGGAEELYARLASPKEIIWHEKSGHELLMDCETEEVIKEILAFPPLA